MQQNIKHIIFDFGAVLLNIDYGLTEKSFQKLGFNNFGQQYSQLRQSTLFDELETRRIDQDAFVQKIQTLENGLNLTETDIIKAWNAMLLDMPMERLQLLTQLKSNYDTFLLSNTNEIHEKAFNEILESLTGVGSMESYFDKVYYSHRVGLRKPDKEVFELILDENDLLPSATLFIDDSPQHIEAAKSLSIQTIYLKKGMTIERDVFTKDATIKIQALNSSS